MEIGPLRGLKAAKGKVYGICYTLAIAAKQSFRFFDHPKRTGHALDIVCTELITFENMYPLNLLGRYDYDSETGILRVFS